MAHTNRIRMRSIWITYNHRNCSQGTVNLCVVHTDFIKANATLLSCLLLQKRYKDGISNMFCRFRIRFQWVWARRRGSWIVSIVHSFVMTWLETCEKPATSQKRKTCMLSSSVLEETLPYLPQTNLYNVPVNVPVQLSCELTCTNSILQTYRTAQLHKITCTTCKFQKAKTSVFCSSKMFL